MNVVCSFIMHALFYILNCRVETKALEKAAATVMRQASQLKRQAESDRVKSLPKIKKNK